MITFHFKGLEGPIQTFRRPGVDRKGTGYKPLFGRTLWVAFLANDEAEPLGAILSQDCSLSDDPLRSKV